MSTPAPCPTTLAAAQHYAAAGLCTIPILPDGSKKPPLPSWLAYQAKTPSTDELERWFSNGQNGIAIVCGNISGGLEVLDFDDLALFEPWRAKVEAAAPGLVARLPLVQSPGPGRHAYFRCAQTGGSRKLARSRDKKTLIEVKGEGGYVLAPGSPAACHPSGRCYEHVAGPPLSEIPLITPAEREAMFHAARSFDAAPEPVPAGQPKLNGTSAVTADSNTISRATAYLAKCAPAISGQGGHDRTMAVARAVCWGFNLGPDLAFDLLWQHYNPRCQPPWSQGELQHKCHDADIKPFDKPRGYLLNDTNHRSYPMSPAPNPEPSGYYTSNRINGSPASSRPARNQAARLEIECLDNVKMGVHTWLCYGFLPWGNVVLIDGDPGTNKSTLATAIAAVVTTGRGFIFGQDVTCAPGRVLFVSPEDSIKATIKPRLAAAGADMRNVDYLKSVTLPDGHPDYLDLGEHLDQLKASLTERQIRLIVIDPLLNHLGNVESKDEKGTRRIMLKLQALAEELNVMPLCIRHFNKNEDNPNKKHRGIGSIAITGTARSVLAVDLDEQNPDVWRVVTQTKVNLAPVLAACSFHIAEKIIDTPDGPNPTPYIDQWGKAELNEPEPESETADFENAIGPNGTITVQTYMHATGYNRDAAKQRLSRAVDAGHLRREARGEYTLVTVTTPNPHNQLT